MMDSRFYLQCRKCRTQVAEDNHVLHAGDEKDKDITTVCDSNTVWYISDDNMPEWISIAVSQDAWQKGKLYCPKCKGRLGSFNFIKMLSCPDCHQHSLPPVHILKDRVDKKYVVKIQGAVSPDVLTQRGKMYTEESTGSDDDVTKSSCNLDISVCQKLTMNCSNFIEEKPISNSQDWETSNSWSTNTLQNSNCISHDFIKRSRLQAEPTLKNSEYPGETTQKNLKHLGEVGLTVQKHQCQTEEKSQQPTEITVKKLHCPTETVKEKSGCLSEMPSDSSQCIDKYQWCDQDIVQGNLTSLTDSNSDQEKDLENDYIHIVQKFFDKAENISVNTMIHKKHHKISNLGTFSNEENTGNFPDKSMSNINSELLWDTSEIDFKFEAEKASGDVDSVVNFIKFTDLFKTERENGSNLEQACSQSLTESENVQGYNLEKNTSLLVKSQSYSLPSFPASHMFNHEFDRDLNNIDLADKENCDVDIHLSHFSLSGKVCGKRDPTESHGMNLELIEDMNKVGLLNDCECLDGISEQFSEIRNLALNTSFKDEFIMEENQCQNEIRTEFRTRNPEIFMQTPHSEITLSEFEESTDVVHPSNNPDVTSFSDQEDCLTVLGLPLIQQPTTISTGIHNDCVPENGVDWDNQYACLIRETNDTNLESFQSFSETIVDNNVTEQPILPALESNNVESFADVDVDIDVTLNFDFLETNERRGRKKRNRRTRQERNCKRRQNKDVIKKDKEVLDLYEPWLIDFPDEHLCPVCFDLFCEPHGCYPCDHILCEACLRRLGQNNVNNTPCPMCRQQILNCVKKKDLVETLKELYPDEYRARLKEQRKYLNNKFSPLPHRRRALDQTQEDIRNRILGQRYQSNMPQPRVKLVLTGFLILVCFVPAVSLGKAVMNSAYGLMHDLMTWL